MVKRNIFKRIAAVGAAFLFVVFAVVAPVNSAYAAQQVQCENGRPVGSTMDKFAESGILFYNPCDNSCITVTAQYATDAEGFGTLSSQQVAFVETYHDIAVMHSINYGIPWETVVSQGILESTSGTSYYARTRNNFFGIGAFDSNPDHAFSYATPEEGWEGYYKNIKTTTTYRQHGVFAGDAITDPYAYLVAIKSAGYATDPNYIEKVSKVIEGVENLSKDRGWPSSAELASQHPEWFENAEANRQGANASSADSGSVASPVSRCNDGSSASLVSGGMTLDEAVQFMQAYYKEAMKYARGNQTFQGAFVHDSGCSHGALNNCSAFTQWFLNKYTSLGPTNVPIIQGSEAVSSYLAKYSQLVDGGKVPRVYAVVSMGPHSGTAEGWPNHTGIVLGINEAQNSIIIGEASCRYSYPPGAHSYDLSRYTNNSSQYGPTYAYTDNVLMGIGE